MNNSLDRYWMEQALEEARKGIGLTAPNPPVGAVLALGETLLASGWHHRAGEAHAERMALSMAKERGITREQMREATLYVTLEPCSTQGRTPPCTEGILEAGIGRVVYGATDPYPGHSGAADEVLKAGGVSVLAGVCREACEHILRPFTMAQLDKRPWIIAKTAFSLDGKIVRPAGEGQWLSGEESRREVHQLRAQVDAILTSGETARRDDPALTIRGVKTEAWKKQPIRAVVTRSAASLSPGLKLFSDEYADRTRVYENVPLRKVMERLTAEEGVHSVLVECGTTLMKSLLNEGLVDEWIAYVAPMICGGAYPAATTFFAETGFAWAPVPLDEVRMEKRGDDLMIRGIVRRSAPSLS